MNRIDHCFAELRQRNEKAFIPYICAGDPSLAKTVEIAHALEAAGADVLELGIPFSDPLADGVANQQAAQRALAAGTNVGGVLRAVAEIRQKSGIPIVLYTYLNPILQFGWEAFHRAAETAGVDGLLILDLPPEEDVAAVAGNLFHIRLVAPTSSPERVAAITAHARGFIYYVSREGVTGARATMESSVAERVAAIRRTTALPIAVGFGIATAAQAAAVAHIADAVVVGSAIVQEIADHVEAADLAQRVGEFVRLLATAVRAPG